MTSGPDNPVSALVRAAARARGAAERADSFPAAAQAVADALHRALGAVRAVRLYTVTAPGEPRLVTAGADESTMDDEHELVALLAALDEPTADVATTPDRTLAGLRRTERGRTAVAVGGELAAGTRFAVVVWLAESAAVAAGAPLLALAAAVRAGLAAHPVDGTPVDPARRLDTVRDALTRLELALPDQVAALEQTVARQQADGRLLDTLREVGARLTAQLDLDRLVQEATDAAVTATGAHFGAFFYNLINEYGESYMLYTLSGVPREAFASFPMPRNTAVFEPTFSGTATVRSDDIVADPRYGHNEPHHGMPEGHLPVRSYLAVPVISPTSHEVLGGFFFGHPATGRFTEAHERLAEGIAGYSAIGLDNARLYARERLLANELQRSLLPTIDPPAGFEVVARYLPAASGSEVGGDWLDVIELPGGRVAFVIGDVMGRGVPAASTMGQLRTAVRAYALLDLPPADVLRNTSLLAATMPGRQFITCVYAVFDPVERSLTYANAGHPAPAVLGPDGSVTFLSERLGMPLRVGEVFAERAVEFGPGSALLLYTDGLVERRGRPLPDGLAELDTAVRTVLGPALDDPGPACDELIQDLTRGNHDDDVAVLFVRDTGAPRRIEVLALAAEPLAANRARRFLAGALGAWGISGIYDPAAMVVTELVSNAVRHSQAPVAMRLHHTPGRLMVEVVDADNRPPRPIQPAVHDENHRGLYIVETLTRRWGSRPTPGGKVVWAELILPG